MYMDAHKRKKMIDCLFGRSGEDWLTDWPPLLSSSASIETCVMKGVVAEEKQIFLMRMLSFVLCTESKNINAVEVFAVPMNGRVCYVTHRREKKDPYTNRCCRSWELLSSCGANWTGYTRREWSPPWAQAWRKSQGRPTTHNDKQQVPKIISIAEYSY